MVSLNVVHSHRIRKTPRSIAAALVAKGAEVETCAVPGVNPLNFEFGRDVFTFYPKPSSVFGVGSAYHALFDFASKNKFQQRRLLRYNDFVTPVSVASKAPEGIDLDWEEFVEDYSKALVRPLRHMKRQGFKIVGGDTGLPIDFIEGQEYISEWLDIEKEYRTIFVEGTPLATFYKSERPWKLTKLDRFRLNEKWQGIPMFNLASIMAVDYALIEGVSAPRVLEVNFAPGLSPKNIDRVVTQLLANRS